MEFLPPNTNVTAAYYCDQLQRLSLEIERKRPRHGKIRLLHDNARPHMVTMSCQKVLDLGWEVLPHPAYSPDLAPTNFHLFRALQNFLTEKKYRDRNHLEQDLTNFFESQSEEFYRNSIYMLPKRW